MRSQNSASHHQKTSVQGNSLRANADPSISDDDTLTYDSQTDVFVTEEHPCVPFTPIDSDRQHLNDDSDTISSREDYTDATYYSDTM